MTCGQQIIVLGPKSLTDYNKQRITSHAAVAYCRCDDKMRKLNRETSWASWMGDEELGWGNIDQS